MLGAGSFFILIVRWRDDEFCWFEMLVNLKLIVEGLEEEINWFLDMNLNYNLRKYFSLSLMKIDDESLDESLGILNKLWSFGLYFRFGFY